MEPCYDHRNEFPCILDHSLAIDFSIKKYSSIKPSQYCYLNHIILNGKNHGISLPNTEWLPH